MRAIRSAVFLGLLSLAALAAAQQKSAADRRAPQKGAPEALSAGAGTLYVGTFSKSIAILDEATERVVGTIPTRTGIPRWMVLSPDRKRFYVTNANMEDIEVVDIASRKVIDSFRMSDGDKKVRVRGYAVDPSNRFLLMVTKTATRQS